MTPRTARLPLQVGRAALAQSARFAATVWLGPVLLIAAAMFPSFLLIMGLGLGGVIALMFAVDAADAARRDRPSDVVFDADGLRVEGGPLDGKRFAWAATAGCEVVETEPRRAIRWLVLSWLALGRIGWLARRARVPVFHLRLPRAAGDPVVLAEAEGGERESLESLRDAILGAAAPPAASAEVALPQELLRCPSCGAPQVPIDQPTMTCPFCNHALDVPAELHDRLRASAVLDRDRAPQAAICRRRWATPRSSVHEVVPYRAGAAS